MINARLAMRSNRDTEETFTTAEAAVILTMAGSPESIPVTKRAVDGVIGKQLFPAGVVKRRLHERSLTSTGVMIVATEFALRRELPVTALRKRIYQTMLRESAAQGQIAAGETVTVNVEAPLARTSQALERFRRLMAFVEVNPEIQRGEPVLRGTRVTVATIAAIAEGRNFDSGNPAALPQSHRRAGRSGQPLCQGPSPSRTPLIARCRKGFAEHDRRRSSGRVIFCQRPAFSSTKIFLSCFPVWPTRPDSKSQHVNELGLRTKGDPILLERIVEKDSTLVTNNWREFLARYKSPAPLHAGLILLVAANGIDEQIQAFKMALVAVTRHNLDRNFEIIGEAATRLSPVIRDNGNIPWARIIAFRNRLIHGYGASV